MKTVKRISPRIWIIAAMAFLMMGIAGPVPAAAAVKNGLVKTKNSSGSVSYSYYSKGKKLKNKWKTLKIKKKKYKFYFGKNGIAYKAPEAFDGSYSVKLYKIGNKKYGFDSDSHLVAGGIYVDQYSNIMVFTSAGKYNASKTKKLRNKFKTFSDTHTVSKNLYKQIKKTFGKPVRIERSKSCRPWNKTDTFKDVNLKYKHYEIQLIYNLNTKEYALNGFYSI